MSRPNPTALFGFLSAVIAVMGGAAALKGGLYVGRHEGDMMHMMQIVFQLADGEVPHRDFMTPIGLFAFWPIALFAKMGFGIGHAAIYSQIFVALLLLPAVWWVALTRFRGVMPYLFGLIVLVLVTALVHGESQRAISFSMHYNRWAWAIAFVAITLAVLPAQDKPNSAVDGIIIGLAMAVLVLLKVTYFAAFILPVTIGLVQRGNTRAIGFAVLAGLAVAVMVTLMMGPAFWFAYLKDILTVSGSSVRPNPGEGLDAVIAAPPYLGGSIAAVLGVIFLRQAGAKVGGLVLLFLLPAFFYVTYQNFANDPQWLLLLAVLLWTMRPAAGVLNGFGWDMRFALSMTAIAAFAFAMPSFLNLSFSSIRHLSAEAEKHTPMLPRSELNADLKMLTIRAMRIDARVPMDLPGSGFEAYADKGERSEPAILLGEVLPQCEIELGLPAWFATITADLEATGLVKDKRIMAADLFSGFWLFGDTKRLIGGAPWYYGGLSGFDSADYLLVPFCPISPSIRAKILEEVAERDDITLTEVRRTPVYILLEKTAN